jgi:membrane-associated phospholipid phosphatase
VPPGTATTVARWLADAGVWWVQATAVVALTALRAAAVRELGPMVRSVAAFGAVGALVAVLKFAVDRPPPHGGPVTGHLGAFPSGHAATATVAGLVLAHELGRRLPLLGRVAAYALAVVWAGAIGWARLQIGVHWLTDVLGGWAAGAVVCGAIALSTSPGGAAAGPGGVPSVRVVRTLDPYAAAWDALVDAGPLPTPFLRSWWLDNLAGRRSVVLLVLDGTELLGGLALERAWSVAGVRRYRVAGGGPLCPDHLDLVSRPDRCAEVVAALRGWFESGPPKVLDLRGLRDGATVLAMLPEGHVSEDEVSPYEPLGTLEAYVGGRSDGYARRMRRRERQVAGRGVVVRRLAPPEMPAALAVLADMHRAMPGRDALVRAMPRLEPVVRAAAARGEVRMYVAERHGCHGGVLLCFAVAGRLSLYQGGRRTVPQFADVGTVLDHVAIAEGCADGLVEVDMLRGDEPYKATFTGRQRRLLRLRAATGLRARALLAAEEAARRTVRTVRERRSGSAAGQDELFRQGLDHRP